MTQACGAHAIAMTVNAIDQKLAPTMRALRQGSSEGPDDLIAITDQPLPLVGPGQVLVRVEVAGVNYADLMQTYGTYVGGPAAPYIAGFELAGEIVALGPGVTTLAIGDHVVGTGAGTYAEYAAAAADSVVPVPKGWTTEQAIGLELNWLTALAALRLSGRFGRGQSVLIHAAAGGVGQAAVRLARHFGARVLGTASPAKRELLRSLGVDEFVDYCSVTEQVPRLTAGQGVDLVLDSVGATTLAASLAVAKPVSGTVVVYGTAAGDAVVSASDLVFRYQVAVMGLHIGVLAQRAPELHAELLREISELVAANVITPGAPQTHCLEDGPAILRRLESRELVGKHVLVPG